jgi:hypothetical protein
MKNKFKLTPTIHKEIINVSRVLPNLVKLNADGSKQMRIITNTIKGSEIALKERKSIKHFSESKVYVQKMLEPVTVNHELEMIKIYQTQGYTFLQKYIEFVNQITKPTVEPKEIVTT